MKTWNCRLFFLAAIFHLGLSSTSFAGGKEVVNHPPDKKPTDPVIEHASEFSEKKIEAEEGDLQAQAKLAKAYETGDGVPKDPAEALKWYRNAADLGNPEAQTALGQMYFKGDAIEQDFKLAAQWFQRAAQQGHHHAQGLLGRMYMKGLGVQEDNLEAYVWFILSKGNMDVGTYLSSKWIVEKLSSEERAEARRRANAFVPKKETPPPALLTPHPIPAESVEP